MESSRSLDSDNFQDNNVGMVMMKRGPGSSEEASPSCPPPPSKKRRRMQPTYVEPARAETNNMHENSSSAGMDARDVMSALFSIAHSMRQLRQLPTMAKLITEIMLQNPSNPYLLISGIRALRECVESLSSTSMESTRFVDTITEAMKDHPEEPMLQIEGCRALARWIRSDNKVILALLGERHRLSILVDLLNRHSHSFQELRCLGLDILRTLACSSAEQRLNLSLQPQCISCIVRVLKENIGDCRAQQVGLSLLSWVVEEEKSRDVVVEEGGFVHALKAMEEHHGDQMVQCNGAATLCWLIHTRTPSNRAALAVNTEGIKTVLNTMSRYIDNPLVFGNCACILSGILISDPTRDDLGGHKTIQLAVQGMQRHKSPKVHRNCLTLLRLMTAMTTTQSTSTLEPHRLVLDNLQTIHDAMKLHPEDAGMQSEACGVFANIAGSSPSARAKIAGAGCIETVVRQCQLLHKEKPRVQQAALWFHSCILHGDDLGNNESVSAFGGGIYIFYFMLGGGAPNAMVVQQGGEQD